jgi:hypothetical protein
MDPDAALEELLELTDEALLLFDQGGRPKPSSLHRMAELVDALDGWLGVGGYLPRRWAGGTRR